jgi:catechol 2,3-dioxygenase-like lactoylglutathione lyase family enzyme
MIGRLNHVAIVMPDLDSAAATYGNALGAWEIASLHSP